MQQSVLKKCFITSTVMLMISTFANLIHIVNAYDSYVEKHSAQVVSAFDG